MNLTFLKPKNKGNLSVKDLTQNYLLKIKTTMQIDLGKTVNKVRDIENQIKEINLPLQKYMDPEAEGLKPLKNITPVLQKEFPLIQCDPSSFRRNRYIAKDFHLIDINTSKSSSKNTIIHYERNRSTPRLLLPQTILEGSRTERFKSERMKLLDLEIEKACLGDAERNKNQSVQARGKSVELVKVRFNKILNEFKILVSGK